MKSIEKNNVSAHNQIKSSSRIQFIGSDNPDKKILILGNSITYHAEKPSIGWFGNWGMAASKAENDYVHILFENTKKICPNVQFCIMQVAFFEVDFCNAEHLKAFDFIKEYSPDIAVLRFGENIRLNNYSKSNLEQSYNSLLNNYLSDNCGHLVFTTCFWENEGIDDIIRKYADIYKGKLIELNDLGDDDSMKAWGKFEHVGVENHPGDLGMKKIAERIYQAIGELI